MKSSDFLDENILQKAGSAVWNWAGRKGYLGKTQFQKATTTDMETRSKETGRHEFVTKLKAALEAGKNSGAIAESYNLNYTQFSKLIESTILQEAQTVDEYLKKYVGALVATYKIDPADKTSLDALIQRFSTAYATGKFPQKEANALWDWIWNVGSVQQRDPKTQQVTGDPSGRGIGDATPAAATPISGDRRDIPPEKTTYARLPIATSQPNPMIQYIPRGAGAAGKRDFEYKWDKSAWFDVTDPSSPMIVTHKPSEQLLNGMYHKKYRI